MAARAVCSGNGGDGGDKREQRELSELADYARTLEKRLLDAELLPLDLVFPAPALARLRVITERPRVGVGVVFAHPEPSFASRFLVGARAGSHGAGRYAFPGGHLEHGESFAACAASEAAEETGLSIAPERFAFLGVTNDVMPEDGLHYITVLQRVQLTVDEASSIRNAEPHKCMGWEWFSREELATLPLFVSLRNFLASPLLSELSPVAAGPRLD